MKLLLLSVFLIRIIQTNPATAAIVCSLIPYTQDFQENLSYLWGKAVLQNVDLYSFLVLSPILILMEIIILVFYFTNRSMLGKPGILFCIIIIFQMLLNAHFLMSAIYFTIQQSSTTMPSSFPPFCSVNSVITAFFETLHLLYMLILPLNIIYVLRSSLKKSKIWTFIYILMFVIASVTTVLLWYEGLLGLNIFGLCGITFIRFPDANVGIPVTIIVFSAVFIAVGIFTIVYFKRHMPNSIGLRKKKRYQQQVLMLYVVGEGAFLVSQSIIVIILYANCSQTDPNAQFFPLITLFNELRLLQCFFIFFVIFRSQNVRKVFRKFLKKIFTKGGINSDQKKLDLLSLQTSTNQNAQDMFNFEEVLLGIHAQSNRIDLLKISQVVTIVSGIYIAYKQYYNINEVYFNPCILSVDSFKADVGDPAWHRRNVSFKSAKKIFYSQKLSIKINVEIIKDFIVDVSLIPRLGILECTMIVHAPKIFQLMLQNDRLQSIFESFELHDNTRKMFDLIEGQGGKSGEFFFFSADNKYVLKTITPEEFQFIDSNLLYFHQHFNRNPDSVLAKIYGLFTFRGDEIQRTYHLILMKNILGCNRNQINRTYDLKGSRYDREVNIEDTYADQLQKMTLKDIDFMKEEGRINVSDEHKLKLREIITKDTIFLKNLNLIDYSLLVVKVNWILPPKNPLFWGYYQRIQSSVNHHEYYHIGVIDYLQQWDLQKKGEKWWKKLIGKKGISAQEPKKYQHRFVTFVSEITQHFCQRPGFENEKQEYTRQNYEFDRQKFDENLFRLKKLEMQAQYFREGLNSVKEETYGQSIRKNYGSVIEERVEIELSINTKYASDKTNEKKVFRKANDIQNDIESIRVDSQGISRSDSSGQPMEKLNNLAKHQNQKRKQQYES